MYSILRCSKLKGYFGRFMASYFWNNFLRFFTEGYLEIWFGALLNIVAFTTSDAGEILSTSVSVITGIL